MGIESLLDGRTPQVAETARRLLAIARDLLPEAVETCEGGDYGVGFAPGYKGLVFVITPLKDVVRLGVAGGAKLDDPAGLLQGRGTVHRHVRIADPAAADAPELRALMARAVAARRA